MNVYVKHLCACWIFVRVSRGMVHSARQPSNLRGGQSDGFFPTPSSMLFARRRCDRCEHWIIRRAAAVRCPVCNRVYHDGCLRELGCKVTAAVLRRSRRVGSSRHWKCGKCDDAAEGEEFSPRRADAHATRDQPHTIVHETPLSVAACGEPRRLSFSAICIQADNSNDANDHAAAPVIPPRHHLDRQDNNKVAFAGGPPVVQSASEKASCLKSILETPHFSGNALSCIENAISAKLVALKRRRKNGTTGDKTPASSLTPAPKRICKQAVHSTLKGLRRGRAAAVPRPRRCVRQTSGRLRAARGKRAKLGKAQVDARANVSLPSIAVAPAAETANNAAPLSFTQQISNCAATPNSVASADAAELQTGACTQQACRERFKALEAKLERVVSGLRDSLRAEITSLQMAHQLAFQQSLAANRERKALASEIENINEYIKHARGLNNMTHGEHADIAESASLGASACCMNSVHATCRSATSVALDGTSKNSSDLTAITTTGCTNTCSTTSLVPSNKRLNKKAPHAVAGSQCKRDTDLSVVGKCYGSKDRIAIVCGDSNLRKLIKPIKQVVRPLNEEIAFHCEDNLSLASAVKEGTNLINVAVDADLKVIMFAGLVDILHAKAPDRVKESLVDQMTEFAHFCKTKSVELTVCSIPLIAGPKGQKVKTLIQETNRALHSAIQSAGADFLYLSIHNSGFLQDGIHFAPAAQTRVALKIGSRLCTFFGRAPQPLNVPSFASQLTKQPRTTHLAGDPDRVVTFSQHLLQRSQPRSLGFQSTQSTRTAKPIVKMRRRQWSGAIQEPWRHNAGQGLGNFALATQASRPSCGFDQTVPRANSLSELIASLQKRTALLEEILGCEQHRRRIYRRRDIPALHTHH